MSHRRPLRVAMIHLSRFALDSRVQRQARALAERGDEVHLICLGERESLRVGAGAIHIHGVRGRKPVGGARAYVREYASFTARALARLTALDARRRFDVVQPHNMPDMVVAAALLPRLRGTPVVLDVHDTFPELYETKFPGPLHRTIARAVSLEERVCAAACSRLIVVTEQARERLESRGVGVGKTSIVMNSPDEGVFGPPRTPVPWPLGAGEPLRVLYHGGLAPRFGVETLIRAVALLSDETWSAGPRSSPREGTPAAGRSIASPPGEAAPAVQLRVCGWGEDRDRLAALAEELAPGRVEVPREPVPFARIPQELERAHIGVVPPLHDAFTELLLPVKLLEYVHMGLPVVASRLPCMSEYFREGEEVRMFNPGDPADLAKVLRELSEDPAGARARAARATLRLPALAWERQRAGYLALVDELTSDGMPLAEGNPPARCVSHK